MRNRTAGDQRGGARFRVLLASEKWLKRASLAQSCPRQPRRCRASQRTANHSPPAVPALGYRTDRETADCLTPGRIGSPNFRFGSRRFRFEPHPPGWPRPPAIGTSAARRLHCAQSLPERLVRKEHLRRRAFSFQTSRTDFLTRFPPDPRTLYWLALSPGPGPVGLELLLCPTPRARERSLCACLPAIRRRPVPACR